MFMLFPYQEVWITEQCKNCLSINHIFIPKDFSYDTKLWECWSCFTKFFLDQDDETVYNIDEFETVFYGQCTQN